MAVPVSFQRDENFVPITTIGFQTSKTITYVASTTGATGTTTLFTVSGTVMLNVFALCTTDLAGSGTIEYGFAGNTSAMGDQQNATAIDANEVWHEAVLAIGGTVAYHWHPTAQSVIQTIATNTVSGGVLTYYCNWIPLTDGATVTAA